jgi:CBS domain containing-hemolysin-like protein
MAMLLTYLFLAVFVSFLCSLLEAVLLSISPSFLALKAKEKKNFGIILQKMKEDVDRPLAAILTLNTIAHTIGAAGVGAQVQTIYGDQFVAIGSAILTFVVLIFSEIIPKTVGASNWQSLAPFTAYTLRFLMSALFPIVFFTEKISDLFGGGKIHKLTREEMIVTAEIGADHGTLKKKESNIIKNLLMLDNIYVYDIMTPRSVMMSLDGNFTVAQVMEKYKPIRYSRIPVFEGDLDNVQGMVHRYEILEAFSNDLDDKKMLELITPIHTVPENISVSACLDQLIHRNEHIFLTVDDYGSTTGLVTLEDAIETLLGVEIVDEFDSVADLRAYALEQWKKRKKTKNFEQVTSS